MKLDNFKELLFKKSEDNPSLQLLIKYMKDDYLVDHVIESLEKMADSRAARNPNSAVIDFAKNMNKQKADMLHDSLSHHASHYKAALKNGDKATADKHMSQIFKTMHMINKFTKNGVNQYSPSPFEVSAVDPKPWERAGYLNTKNRDGEDTGKYTTDTAGWVRHGASTNYDWLRGAPHPDSKKVGDSHYAKEVSKHGHNKAYPLEEIKVNGKYIDVDDNVETSGEFTPHPLDSHPIYDNYKVKPEDYNSEKHAEYHAKRDKFHNDEDGGKAQYRNKIANISKEQHMARGQNKANAVHADVPGLEVKDKKPSTVEGAPSASAATTTASLPANFDRGSLKLRLKQIREMAGKKND